VRARKAIDFFALIEGPGGGNTRASADRVRKIASGLCCIQRDGVSLWAQGSNALKACETRRRMDAPANGRGRAHLLA